jgi:hypothetical protein
MPADNPQIIPQKSHLLLKISIGMFVETWDIGEVGLSRT